MSIEVVHEVLSKEEMDIGHVKSTVMQVLDMITHSILDHEKHIKVNLRCDSLSPSHKLCKPPERCKIESTDQEVLLWQEEIEIRNVKQSGKR